MNWKRKIEGLISQTIPAGISFSVDVPDPRFGHYATNVAFPLGKHAGKNPRDVAVDLIPRLKKHASDGMFAAIAVAGAGFINFTLAPDVLAENANAILKEQGAFGGEPAKKETVIVEYSQPNVAKKMHVGHLRTTIIGDAIANLYAFLGYAVIRWNYIGDWGTQFGKLVVAYRLWRDQIAALYKTKNIAPDTVTMLQDLYVMFHDQAKRHPELEQRAQEEFRKLEEGDEENRKLWKFFCDESLKEFGKSYETLGVQFDTYRGESAYENDLKPLVASLLKQRIAVESEGAVIINLDKFNLPPALVRKSDGASLYLTRDIANLQYRIKKHHPARIIYVVGNEQALHFEQLFAIARLMKLNEAELTHVKYGLVLDENHKKLSTREGRVIPLGDVVEKAIALARAIANKNEGLSEEERETVARTIAIGALKYNDLAQGRLADIAFNWDRMLALRGDSAPYLQYTYARFRNIARKGKSPLKFWARTRADAAQLTDERELRVLRELLYFPHIVRDAADAYEPHHVANYLHRLADALNALYEAVPILKAPADARASRLALVEASTIVLKNGLGLLGIGVVEKM